LPQLTLTPPPLPSRNNPKCFRRLVESEIAQRQVIPGDANRPLVFALALLDGRI
jgi:hypothetical protein